MNNKTHFAVALIVHIAPCRASALDYAAAHPNQNLEILPFMHGQHAVYEAVSDPTDCRGCADAEARRLNTEDPGRFYKVIPVPAPPQITEAA